MMMKKLGLLAAAMLLSLSLSAAQNDTRITPNFQDADILQVIAAVRQATGRTFIIDPRVRGNITMLSSTPMTANQFFEAFQSILSVYNFVAITTGNIVKILPADNARQMPGVDLTDSVSSTSDSMVTQIIAVKSVSAAQLVAVLRPLMPTNANLATVTGSNLLIITDRANNVRRIMNIISDIDKRGNSDVEVVPLANATAADAVRTITTVFTNTGAEVATTLKVVADDRTNSVIISGDSTSRLRAKSLLVNLDSNVDAGTRTEVRVLEYADAEATATKLKEQFTGSTGTSVANSGRVGGPGPAANPAAPGGGAAQNAAAANAAVGGTVSLAGGTATIIADKDTNALIITASPRIIKALDAVLKQMDVRTPQVLIEAIIAEVSQNGAVNLGVNWAVDGSNVNLAAGAFTPSIIGSDRPLVDLYGLTQGATTTATIPQGTVLGVGRLSSSGINFAAVLQALQSDSRNNIVARPQVLTLNNKETKITVARKVPFVTGQYTGTTGTTSAFQTINREEVGTLFTVTPRITKGDRVALEIQVESSEVESQQTAGAAGLVTKDNTIDTSVLIRNGDWLVLGGMISDSSGATEARVPLLGRIPILGELFRSRGKTREKRNLMMFIKPTIIRDDEQAALTTDAKYDFMRDQQKLLNRETTLLPLVPLKGVPVLPENQSGVVTPPKPAAAAPAPAPSPAAAPATPAASGTRP